MTLRKISHVDKYVVTPMIINQIDELVVTLIIGRVDKYYLCGGVKYDKQCG